MEISDDQEPGGSTDSGATRAEGQGDGEPEGSSQRRLRGLLAGLAAVGLLAVGFVAGDPVRGVV